MSKVLSEEKRKQIEALGRLGWSLRRIEEATGVRRETASTYLKGAAIAVRAPRGRRAPKPANEDEALTEFSAGKPPIGDGAAKEVDAKPASREPEAPTDLGPAKAASEALTDAASGRSSSQISRCEPHRAVIERDLGRGRNAVAIWQELVVDCGFTGSYTSVRRFVGRLRGAQMQPVLPRSAACGAPRGVERAEPTRLESTWKAGLR
jgi:transposase